MLTFLSSRKKRVAVNFKIYDVKTWEKTTAIHILPNISRSKSNQTMKFDKLIKYNSITWETFFLQNQALFPRPFLKNQNRAYIWIDSLKLYICFYCMLSWGLSKYTETKLQTIQFCLILSFFKKQKEGEN